MLAEKHTDRTRQEKLAQVVAALEEKNIPLATDMASQAIADGIEHPLFLNLRAFQFESDGHDAEALSDLRRAASLAPHDACILNALGLAYFRCGQHSKAIAAFEAAVEEQPGFSQAHFNNGWSREEIGDLTVAKKCYLRAHQTHSDAPEPLGRLAALAARRGEWMEVCDYADRALALDRSNAAATLALGKPEIEKGVANKAEERLRAFLRGSS